MKEKYIKYVPPQRVFALDGVFVVGTVIQRDFLLEVTAQPSFTAGKQGIEAVEFAIEARKAIREQGEERARARGSWAFDDDVARAIKRAIEEGQWNHARGEALLPLMKAGTDLLSEQPPAPAPVLADGEQAPATN